MAGSALGLRAKSMLALALACVLALVPATLVAWLVLDGVRSHFGEAYARNYTELKLREILAPIARELALARRLAGSELTRQWLQAEGDEGRREMFFREAEGFREDFGSRSYFLISALSGHYYFNADAEPDAQQPRYVLDPQAPKDAWFFNTMASQATYNININPDPALGTTRVWLNAIIEDADGRRIGLAGTGLDLGDFIREFVAAEEPGVTAMILDESGAIQAHPDRERIAFGSAAGVRAQGASGLEELFPEAQARHQVREAMEQVIRQPDKVQMLRVVLDGREQLLALAHAPELGWVMLSAVDLNVVEVLESAWVKGLLAMLAALTLLLLGLAGWAVDRMVLQPLRGLRESAVQIAGGHYDVSLPAAGRDEIGDLSRAFGRMLERVRRHAETLESQVQERTAALERSNHEMERAGRQIRDSIDYASLIQRAILPDRQLQHAFGEQHFVLWRPKDIVGGDFYVFFQDAQDGARSLVGVLDCAGHGVPGALMTMLARAAVDHAVQREGMESPAALLHSIDETMRSMLADVELSKAVASNADAGLVYIDREAGLLRFAGARISLFRCVQGQCSELPGNRRALGERRRGEYEDVELPLVPGMSAYLLTDGVLDQAGGLNGFGFGVSRLSDLLCEVSSRPMPEQAVAIEQALEQYRGAVPQRDDITVLAFRLD